MSGVYTVQFNGVTVSALQDLFELVAHASRPMVLLGFGISQSSDVGDAAEEGLLIRVESGATTSGSGGSTPTPVSTDSTGSAAGFTCEANNTTRATAGTIVTHYSFVWNVRVPLDVIFTEQMQLVMAAGRRLVISLPNAPADALTVSGYAVVQEIG